MLTSFHWSHYGVAPRAPQTQCGASALRALTAEQVAQREPGGGYTRARTEAAQCCRQSLLATQDPRLLVVVGTAQPDTPAYQDLGVAVKVQARGEGLTVL